MNIEFRRYTSGDFKSVKNLIEEVLAEHNFKISVGGLQKDLELLNSGSNYDNEKSSFWVAVDNKNVIGTVAIRNKDNKVAELKRLYVHKDYRGLGIGKKLYMLAESFAKDKGYQYLWLDSSRRFKDAAKLYKKNGFKLLAELDNDWEDNIYQKQL